MPSILELIELVYAGAETGETWGALFDGLARAIPFDQSALHMLGGDGRTADLRMQTGLDSAAENAYQQHYCYLNPFVPAMVNRASSPVYVGEELLPFDTYRRSAFYQEFGARNHVAHGVACHVAEGQEGAAVLSLNRRHSTGVFTPDEVGVIRMLAPHLRRAIRIRGRLAEWKTAMAIRDSQAQAFLVLDERLRIRDASAGVESLLRNTGLVSMRHGTLSIAAAYRELVGSLVRGERHSATLREDDGRPLPVRATPLPASASPGGSRLTVLLFAPPCSGDWARRLAADFGLTPAEIRLTHSLLESDSLARAAESLGISINTAKTQLASIFRRTGVKSQKELAQLAARLGAP
jgi:DNA-binding CsgD family transcriptional regulator